MRRTDEYTSVAHTSNTLLTFHLNYDFGENTQKHPITTNVYIRLMAYITIDRNVLGSLH